MPAPDWHVIHRQHDDDIVAQFVPQNISFTLNKGENGPHELSYEASRSQDGVFPGFVSPYGTDFELWRGDLKFMTGMHTAFSIQSNQESVQITGKNYLHYLDRRQWPFDSSDPALWKFRLGLNARTIDDPPAGYSYAETNVEVSDVIRDMLDVILMDDNCLDFTYFLPGLGNTMETFSIGLPDTESILSKIQTLAQEDPGEFDFYMDQEKILRFIPGRQYDTDVYDDASLAEHIFDSRIPESGFVEVSFTNTGPIQTWLLGQGQAIRPANTREYLLASNQFRRLDGSVGFDAVPGTTRVDRLTRKALLFGLNPIHEITLEVAPEKINNFWTRFTPGTAIWVQAFLEAWEINSAQEIVSIDCNVSSGGDEQVTLKLNQIYASEGIVP